MGFLLVDRVGRGALRGLTRLIRRYVLLNKYVLLNNDTKNTLEGFKIESTADTRASRQGCPSLVLNLSILLTKPIPAHRVKTPLSSQVNNLVLIDAFNVLSRVLSVSRRVLSCDFYYMRTYTAVAIWLCYDSMHRLDLSSANWTIATRQAARMYLVKYCQCPRLNYLSEPQDVGERK
jgi:hypothetical protein